MKIESRIGKSSYPDSAIYNFITDFNNFKNLIPKDQVTDWESEKESCRFKIDPVGKTGLEIIEKAPSSLVKISSIPELSQYDFTIWIQIIKVDEGESKIKITIEPRVNEMILQFVKSPLKQFVDGLIDSLEKFDFNQ